jgi:hypothetical protein
LSFLSFFPVAAVPLFGAADFLEDDCSRERSLVGAVSSSDELEDGYNIKYRFFKSCHTNIRTEPTPVDQSPRNLKQFIMLGRTPAWLNLVYVASVGNAQQVGEIRLADFLILVSALVYPKGVERKRLGRGFGQESASWDFIRIFFLVVEFA